ncbi:MAG: hypothetical protein LBS19_01635 [Clostridiales bacterium]|jgi:hypothetical protein|nr:hypothetical protein [Clostridiales bacterium]
MTRPKRVFSGQWEPEVRNPKRPGMFRGLFNPRIVIPILLVFGVYIVVMFAQDRSGKPAADVNEGSAGNAIPFNYVIHRGDEYMLAQVDIMPEEGLSDAMMLEKGLKNPPAGYLPIAEDALIGAITLYENSVEIDFAAHPCPDGGERERLTAIAWTAGDFFNAEFVRIKVNGKILEEVTTH